MNFFVILTTECDLECSYCYGKIWDGGNDEGKDKVNTEEVDCFLPLTVSYDVQKLADFCAMDKECGIMFYGGEPMLQPGKIMDIMERVPAKDFMIQTNGLHLAELPEKYLARLSGLQISVDGDKSTTDGYRGTGVYDRIIHNLSHVTPQFKGELIARMTVREQIDIYKQVMHLVHLGLFDAVHWQLDAGFGPDYGKRKFGKWAREIYNPGITKLADEWLSLLRMGIVMRLYPFLGIMQSLLAASRPEAGGISPGEAIRLRCGAGWAHYAIQTDGNIVPCPVMAGMKKFYAGDLSSSPNKLKEFEVGGRCTGCEMKGTCGGRCLFANEHDFWGSGYDDVCGTVKHLLETMIRIKPEVEKLIREGVISFEDFGYTEFNSCEIIP